jgi:hypothetical protein
VACVIWQRYSNSSNAATIARLERPAWQKAWSANANSTPATIVAAAHLYLIVESASNGNAQWRAGRVVAFDQTRFVQEFYQ